MLIVVMGAGALIGLTLKPDAWYASLRKPPFNPPNWVFGPVWSALYICIAISGWRSLRQGVRSPLFTLWEMQIVLNWMWTPVWFGLHATWPSFLILAALVLTVIAFVARAWSSDRIGAFLFVPYLVWLLFAGSLNLSIAIPN